MRSRILTLIVLLAAAGLTAGCSKCDDFWGPKSCRSDVPVR